MSHALIRLVDVKAQQASRRAVKENETVFGQ